jgi:hypothetical protein
MVCKNTYSFKKGKMVMGKMFVELGLLLAPKPLEGRGGVFGEGGKELVL